MTRRGGLNTQTHEQRALDSQTELRSAVAAAYSSGTHELPLDEIDITGEWNPRGSVGGEPYSEQELLGLMAAIQEYGQLQPVLVRPHPNGQDRYRYQLVAGWRRYHSCRLLGRETVLASSFTFRDDQLDALSTLENTQREELNQFEVVRGVFRTLAQQVGVQPEQIPAMMSKILKTGQDPHDLQDRLKVLTSASLSTFLTKYAKVLKLRPEEIRAVYARYITPTVALELVRLGDREQRSDFLQQAIDQAWSTRVAKDHINEALKPAQPRPSVHLMAERVTRQLKPGRLNNLTPQQSEQIEGLLAQLEAVLAPQVDAHQPQQNRTKQPA